MKKIKTNDIILDHSTEIRGVVAIEQKNRRDGFKLSGYQTYSVYSSVLHYLRQEGKQNRDEEGITIKRSLSRK